MKEILLWCIAAYQHTLSPDHSVVAAHILMPGLRCRFFPSCSEYTKQAVTRYGAARGMALGAKRLLRCRPGGGAWHDPVPEHAT